MNSGKNTDTALEIARRSMRAVLKRITDDKDLTPDEKSDARVVIAADVLALALCDFKTEEARKQVAREVSDFAVQMVGDIEKGLKNGKK